MNVSLPSWVDDNGYLHISIPEFLEALGMPNTPENQEIARQEIARAFKAEGATTPVIYRPEENDRRYDVELDAEGNPVPHSN